MNEHYSKQSQGNKSEFLFGVFVIWTFLLLCHLQDFFPFLAQARPVLISSLIMLLLFIIRSRGHGSGLSFNNTQIKLYAALICVMVMSIPFSYNILGAFMEIFTQYIKVIIFFYIFSKLVDSDKKIEKILFSSCLGVGLYSVFVLAQGRVTEGRLGSISTFDANDLSYFTLSFLPFNLIFLFGGNSMAKKLACLGNLIAGMLVILVTGSRGGIIAFSVVMFMLLMSKTRTIRFSHKIVFVALCLVAVLVGASKINFERYETIGTLDQDYNVSSESGRIAIWKTGLKLMLLHPLTGVGVSCFNEALSVDRHERGEPPKGKGPHSSLIQIGTETGVIGLILFVLMSFRAFKIFRRVEKEGRSEKLAKIGGMARVGLSGHFIAGMFIGQAYSIYWAFYIALSAVLYDLITRETNLS
jgi:O-antigen ligase